VANLVDNALRHNIAEGRVEIATGMVAGKPTISVSNTGAAVPSHEIDRLFQPFQQLTDERTHHTDGHGLGLAIVRAIARAHGAALSAHPRPEGGLEIEVGFSP
jgi:signal transduction histidine kinase